MTTAIDIHTHLLELQAERALASIEGLAVNSVYMADLDGEIEATARAYVGAAVTEIATFRAELSGPQVGSCYRHERFRRRHTRSRGTRAAPQCLREPAMTHPTERTTHASHYHIL